MDPNLNDRILIAIPKKGRLNARLIPLLEKIGLTFQRKHRLDIAHVVDPSSPFAQLTLVFLPAHDIATFVSQGNVDMGITGIDITQEADEHSSVEIIGKLGFGACRLSLCAPKGQPTNPEAYIGKRIATSFPRVTTEYFNSLDTTKASTTRAVNLSGSVEVACSLGLADAIVDLVETGTTLAAAGLVEVHAILKSEAIMIANPKSKHKDVATKIVNRIKGIIDAEQYVMLEYDIPKDKLEEAKKISPGKVSPSILPLADPDWVAVKVLEKRNSINNILDQLEEIGAVAIVVTNIDNCRA